MVRKIVALLVSGAVWLGPMNAASSAQTPSAQQSSVVPAISTVASPQPDRNPTPLPPGGPAGIRQAQGQGETVWHIIGLGFFTGVVLAMILVGNPEDDEVVTTTTTN